MFNLAETDRLLSTTRAVRRRLDLERPVEREVILDCLRLAIQAPTASNSQTWRFVVVTDPGQRQALADLYCSVGRDYLEDARRRQLDPQTVRVYESAYALTEILERVPVLVIPCMMGRVDGKPNHTVAAAYGSILPATWSFQLALRARGLGSTLTTFHLVREKQAAAILGIPDDVTQVAMLPVAYTMGDEFKPAARGPVEDITCWDQWIS
jgi:nitroreductase